LIGAAGGLIALLWAYSTYLPRLIALISDLMSIAKMRGTMSIGWTAFSRMRQRGATLFDREDFEAASAVYVEPDCLRDDPSDTSSPNSQRRTPLFTELRRLLPNSRYRYVFLLADSGMGKTSFVLNYYLRHLAEANAGILIAVPLGKGREVVDP